MAMTADLHLHTKFSDGTYTPEELVAQAKAKGFSAIALTDHDTIAGCPRAAVACKAVGIEFITGSELTSEHEGIEIHVLAYFVDPSHAEFSAEMTKFQAARQDRIRQMCAALNAHGVPLMAEDVFAVANCESPGRPHVARALIAKKLCRDFDEAFEHYLKRGRPAFVPKFKMTTARAIELIHSAGGLAVMAHPALNRNDDVIPAVVEAGLDGIEVFHTKHNSSANRRYMDLAKKHDLLITGGSDCHGLSKGRPLIGMVKLDYSYVEKMKERHAGRLAAK